jgi:hypothetical protein
MNIKIKQSILRNGKRYNEGETIDLPNNISEVWIQKGLACKISKKVNKSKFETKELKTDYKETK